MVGSGICSVSELFHCRGGEVFQAEQVLYAVEDAEIYLDS